MSEREWTQEWDAYLAHEVPAGRYDPVALEQLPIAVRNRIQQALADREPVIVRCTDETGAEQWAIELVNTPGFWMTAFLVSDDYCARQKAISYCEANGLPYTAAEEL